VAAEPAAKHDANSGAREFAVRAADMRNVPIKLVHVVAPIVAAAEGWSDIPVPSDYTQRQEDHARQLIEEAHKVAVEASSPCRASQVTLAAVLPRSFRFVAGEALQGEGLTGFVLKRLSTEFVERNEREHGVADTDRVVALARTGQSLVIFPEGRLARAPGLRPFHMGAFVVAAEAGVPVVPVAIRGTRAILRPEHHFPRRGSVEIAIGVPVQPTGTDWAAAVKLQRAVRTAVLRLSGEPDVG